MAHRINVIKERKQVGDLEWSLKSFSPDKYELSQKRNPQQIKQHVLNSPRVQYVILQLSEKLGQNKEAITKEAKIILEEMGHHMQLGTVRCLGFVLSKLMKRLYTGIFINQDGVEKLKKIVSDYPILFMPTHRSYVDFLLVSYLCFMFDLPVPAIAAGLDFLSMKGINVVLRNAGAFFIRRSFGKDQLYWSIFTEYVETHIVNGDAPVEFFVEGTRSRTAKTLTPKLGFLMAALEPYFKSQIPDLAVVPISITYDRTLEESLYSYELLGVPKPKESTKGLFKARQILDDCYGAIHVEISDPIILGQFCADHQMKRVPRWGPRYLSPLNAEEQRICKQLAYHVVRRNQTKAVVSSFSVIAAIMLVNLQEGHLSLPLDQLIKTALMLRAVICDLGSSIDWKENTDVELLVQNSIAVHHFILEVVEVQGLRHVQTIQHEKSKPAMTTLNRVNLKGHSLTPETVVLALPHLMLSHYSNQLLHVFIRISFITLPLCSLQSHSAKQDALYAKYTFLEKLLNNDFIFEPGQSEADFKSALKNLEKLNIIFFNECNEIVLKDPKDKLIFAIHQLVEPFLISYRVVCHQVLQFNNQNMNLSISAIKRDAQAYVEKLLEKKCISHFVSLSLDILSNAVYALLNLGALEKDKRQDEITISCNRTILLPIISEIDLMLKHLRLVFEDISIVNLPAKL